MSGSGLTGKNIIDYSLYFVSTSVKETCLSHIDTARLAISGGATVIQYREKSLSFKKLYQTAIEIKKLTDASDIPLIINDRMDLAMAVRASGVHLGQDDADLRIARDLLGEDAVIGITVGNIEQAVQAEKGGADYLGVSPIFPTPSKDDAGSPIGCQTLKAIKDQVQVPLVAIGGITPDNVSQVIESGADGIAVISAIANQPDPEAAASDLLKRIKAVKSS